MIPLVTVVKMLRIALGYGSRTERVARLLNSPDTSVSMMANSLMHQGYLDRFTGSVNIPPK